MALFGLVVRHLAGGLADSSLWQPVDEAAAELGPIEERTRRIAAEYRIVELGAVAHMPPQIRSMAFVDVSAHHGKYDKTQLLLAGQDRADLSVALDLDTLSLAARFGSGVNFLEVLGLSGGMPTLVSIPKKRMPEALSKLGVSDGDRMRLVGD
jgi:hypothetical protein